MANGDVAAAHLLSPEAATLLAGMVRQGNAEADRLLSIHAANGSLAAQRAFLDILVGPGTSIADLTAALLLARLAAFHGDISDHRRKASILWSLAMEWRAVGMGDLSHVYAVEALSLVRDLADAGDGHACEMLATLAPDLPDAAAAAGLGAGVPRDDPK